MSKKNRSDKKMLKIAISSTFNVRSRCKYCYGKPNNIYFIRDSSLSINPKKTNFIYNRSILFDYPRLRINSMIGLNEKPRSKYNPKLHNNKYVNPYPIAESFCCKCGQTSWETNFFATSTRPEISMRKSKKIY